MPLRLPFDLPALDAKSQILCHGIKNLHVRLLPWDITDLHRIATAARTDDAVRRLVAGLQDELSDMFPDDRSTQLSGDKAMIEAKVLGEIARLDVESVCSNEDAFIDFLVETRRKLLPESGPGDGLRTRPVQSLADENGRYVVYPPSTLIRPTLGELSRLATLEHERNPVLLATYVMVNLCAIHPFRDGNGRLSRVIFSWLLARATENPIYVPLFEFSDLSRNGWFLALRRAQFQAEWGVIIRFILTCLRVMSEALTGRQTDDPTRAAQTGQQRGVAGLN